jgi:hypothetical protein
MPIPLRDKIHSNTGFLRDASRTAISNSSIPRLAVLIPTEFLTLPVVPLIAPNQTTSISIESKSFAVDSAIHD